MSKRMKEMWEVISGSENIKVWVASWLAFAGSRLADMKEFLGIVSLILGISYTSKKLWDAFFPKKKDEPKKESSIDHGTNGTFGAVVLMSMLAVTGCMSQKTPTPQKGGKIIATLPFLDLVTAKPVSIVTNGEIPQVVISAEQPENPNTPTEHSYTRTVEQPDGTKAIENFSSKLGTTQHDKARDDWGIIAVTEQKLKSARLPQILGFFLVLASLAMFHPIVRRVTMSGTLQLVTGGLGLALMFLSPMLATADSTLVTVGIGVPIVYYFIWKHGKLQGIVDANKNGIPDDQEVK